MCPSCHKAKYFGIWSRKNKPSYQTDDVVFFLLDHEGGHVETKSSECHRSYMCMGESVSLTPLK